MKPFTFACLATASLCTSFAVLEAARPQYGGTLRIETRAAIRTLDPAATIADRDEAALAARLRPLVFETLVQVDPAGSLQPVLALSWDSDPDGRRWRFRLRPGVI